MHVPVEMATLCIILLTKAEKSNGSSRAEMFKILPSIVSLVFKNTKWSTCACMLFVPMVTGHIIMDLGFTILGLGLVVCCAGCVSHYSLFPFFSSKRLINHYQSEGLTERHTCTFERLLDISTMIFVVTVLGAWLACHHFHSHT